MKNLRKFLALTIALVMVFGSIPSASASEYEGSGGAGGFGKMPAGTYTYVSGTPTAEVGSGAGQVQFLYREKDNLAWAFDMGGTVRTGIETISKDEFEFFKGVYLSDLPVTDWLGGNPKNTEGYAGNVAGNFRISIEKDGKISRLSMDSGQVRVLAAVTKDITAETLTVYDVARGQPNLLQSCITLLGSTNGLYLTYQGDVIMDGITIGHDENGVGLTADKIGGDTFIVGTVLVDGTVEWNSLKGIMTALGDRPGTLLTTGKDISIPGGSNIGRVGRNLSISTGEELGGNITIGAEVFCDATRGGLLPNADRSTDSLAIATSGSITAGLGDVIIGTNTEKAVLIDMIGDIQGANVTIKPNNYGSIGDVSMSIGNATATGSVDIVIGRVNSGEERFNISQSTTGAIISTGNTAVDFEIPENPMGNLTSLSGNISLTASDVGGGVGNISAAKGKVNVTIESAEKIGDIAGAHVVKNIGFIGVKDVPAAPAASTVIVDGKVVEFDAYTIGGNNYFKLRDLAYTLSGTQRKTVLSSSRSTRMLTI